MHKELYMTKNGHINKSQTKLFITLPMAVETLVFSYVFYITNNEKIICYKNRDHYSDSQLLQQGHYREAFPNIKITTTEGCNLNT